MHVNLVGTGRKEDLMSERTEKSNSISGLLARSRRRSRAMVRRLERRVHEIAYILRTADAQLGANLYFSEAAQPFQERGHDSFAEWARSMGLDAEHALRVFDTYRDLGGLYHAALLWGASPGTIQRLRKMTPGEIEHLERRLSHGNTKNRVEHIHRALKRSVERRRNRRKSDFL